MIWCADSATGHSAVRSGNATSTEIIGVTDPIKVSWKEEKETGQSCRGHLEVILLLLLEKFAGQYPVYHFFLKEIILKKHAEKYGIATAFWMLLTVLECWNVHSSWKSDGRISRAVCWMRESQCATKWCAHVISPLHATLKFSWWHVDDTVSFRFRYSNYI